MCSMSSVLYFMNSYVKYFPDNLEDYSVEYGKKFYQDIRLMEERYQARWDENMMADNCWTLKRD